MAKRYNQLLSLIAEVKPRKIVEVGVHRGKRAAAMSIEMMRHVHEGEYLGFDVFDTMGEAFQKAALNGKGTPTEKEARAALSPVAAAYLGFKYRFVIGDTAKTLHGNPIDCDFAFIDGDHRVSAIRGDWEAVSGAKIVVFDDYYSPGMSGQIPDLKRYGSNAVVDELMESGKHVAILPVADLCNHGAYTQLAVVWQ